MVGYIYLNTNLLTGLKYAGQHHYDKPELDPNYHGSGVLWTEVYNNTPKEFIKEEYIKTCYSQEELNESEDFNIEKYNTLYPNGYNLKKGGCYSELTIKKLSEVNKCEKNPMFGKHQSDETRKRISEAHKGKHHSDEARKKMSESRKGKHPSVETKKKIGESRKGKHHKDETRKKISEILMNGKLSKTVLQFTLDGEFVSEWSSIRECGRNGFSVGHVSACCNGEEKSHKKFLWLYKDDIYLLQERVDSVKNKRKGGNPLKKLQDYSCYGQPLF